ncbi:MAG: hypothetical protein C0403_18080, partial [Desulfobacterium sp.]|nr:hypothetical protein [Desulfobacterium sp.]
MPRTARMINSQDKTAYHIMSRTALDGYPFGDVEKDELVTIIQKFSKLFFMEVFGYCIMGNHFHLLVQVFPELYFSDDEVRKRCRFFYGDDFQISDRQVGYYREKLSSLPKYMKEIKQAFSSYYNKRHNRRGTLWGDRYKSVIVEQGETLINCLAYIDLNPVRAGIVEKPEAYRWSSIGYHLQTQNKDGFLSFDFGLQKFGPMDAKERLRQYREFVYESGAINTQKGRQIDPGLLKNERKKKFQITRADRFQNRTRYFTDSGIIGSKEFVRQNYQRFQHLFQSRNEKIPKSVSGL